ncbi:mycofactocin biosynthesis peptidyl-dipeptidase MftE [Amycolatopsis carbonis]|uniref:Mycofactocin biosynthesis peptidyl-dipeptidase MftE n=1 Tax=Amycolatopsis carbonis TaxID=715471 RepID=A0A9Y2ID85_9PSEU|nr:mycofactocin biosynthesis peptidyl-dipeptidase MftE [Amycolatopsis sp. 2-15]WIX77146.1 mycofactocin biosynthesis peptidyl-dipeptidase MftE [Amycolatopsis sp. 2-15]
MHLSDLPFPEVARRAAAGAVLAVPVGATEQHGPHLPLSTDTDIALALCDALATAWPDVLVAPAVPYGSSGEHAGFAGTLSIGQAATELLLVELGRSATGTFGRVLFVSAHGGNAEPVARAVATLRSESREVSVFQPRWNGEPHAGAPETALQLVLRPAAVHMERAVVGDRRPLREVLPLLRSGGVRAVTDTGVLGDPTGATAAEGHTLLASLTAQLLAHVSAWLPAVAL